MVNTCVIYGCQNRANRGEVGRSYHAVPKVILSQGDQTKDLSTKRRELWIARIERKDWTPSQYSNVCSDHFVTGKPSALYDRAHPDWAPSLKLRQESPAANVSENPEAGPSISLKRYARSAKRQKKKVEFETAQTLLNMSTSSVDSHQATDSVGLGENPICTFSLLGKLEHGPCGQEDNLNANNAPLMKKVRTEVQHLTTENMELGEKVSSTKFTPEALSKQEDKLRYFTGLPGYLTLMQFFQLLEPYLTDSVKASLTKFEKLILVLRKLRLNLPIQDSAYRFNVSKPTVSWIFNSVIRIMYERLGCLIYIGLTGNNYS